jgi:hypothetical protein
MRRPSGDYRTWRSTPTLRVAGFEDDDEDENEAPGEALAIARLKTRGCVREWLA